MMGFVWRSDMEPWGVGPAEGKRGKPAGERIQNDAFVQGIGCVI